MSDKVKLEVCVDGLESALAALNGGADRLELCSALADGGLTPTPGFLAAVQKLNGRRVPVYCLLRCRPGDFVYAPDEIEIMKEDARALRKNCADGFAFGALRPNGDVDMKTCREVIKVCHPLPVTFHRAFDFCRRPTIEVEVIIDLGFGRILTSGKRRDARTGAKLIRKLVEQVGRRIVVVAAGGVNKENVKSVVENTEVKEVHGSFRAARAAPPEEKVGEEEEEGAVIGERGGPVYVTDENAVAEVVDILKTV